MSFALREQTSPQISWDFPGVSTLLLVTTAGLALNTIIAKTVSVTLVGFNLQPKAHSLFVVIVNAGLVTLGARQIVIVAQDLLA